MSELNDILLAVCIRSPLPVRDGFSLRIAALLRELGKEWRTVLLAPSFEGGGNDELGVFRCVHLAVPQEVSLFPWRFDAGTVRAQLLQAIIEHRPKAVLLWTGTHLLLSKGELGVPTVLDLVDCITLDFARHLRTNDGAWRRPSIWTELVYAARHERQAAREAYATVVVGERDAKILGKVSGKEIHVVPNGVEPPGDAVRTDEAAVPTVIFVGTLTYPPNVDACLFCAREIWPRVRARVPDARLIIAGRGPGPEILSLATRPGISVAADVPDMFQLLGTAWVSIAPMRSGVGIKNKVLEAWACGKPVVMTPIATNGLEIPEGSETLVIADAAELAHAVADLLMDEPRRRTVGAAARRMVVERFSWARAAAKFSALLRSGG